MQIENNSLKTIKENMINKVVDELVSISNMNKTDGEAYKKELLSNINNKILCTTIREQSGLTNAKNYNLTAYELYIDILTTFDYINSLYDTINKHQKLNQSIVNTLNSTIGVLNDKLTEIEAVIGVKGSPECYLETFRSSNNQEDENSFYEERYGENTDISTRVKFNQDQENITLNYTRCQNVAMYNSGIQFAELSLTKQYGAGFIKAKNAESKLNNALDTSKSNYWSESILCDSEFKIKGAGYDDATTLGQYSRSYYNFSRGALCEVCITFETLTKVNELILNPFGDYPIDIIGIRYSLVDSDKAECYDVLNPDGTVYSWLNTTSIKKETSFHFPDIVCKKLYILLNQLHCTKDTYLLSSDQMFKNELWFNATNPETELLNSNFIFKPLYDDRAREDAVWTYINNKMTTDKDIDINDLLINSKNTYLPCTKYQYTYGFYNIIPNYVEYQNTGIYVSKEIQASGIIKTVTLTTDEQHFNSLDNGRPVTDIEYYITTSSNPTYLDWTPICPSNKTWIKAERLQIDYDVCYLLYPAICRNVTFYDDQNLPYTEMIRPIVRKDDTVLEEDIDYTLHLNDSLNVESIEIANLDQFSIYTVEYMPADEGKEINLIESDSPTPNNTHEVINGSGAACYELSEYPYYNQNDPDSTNTYVKIVNIDTGTILVQDSREQIVCVTNKMNTANSYKNMSLNSYGVSLTNSVEYYTYGKYIYFNRPILSSEKIEITYPSFQSKIRLKAILRKNSKRDFWITPILNSFKFEFSTI